MTVKTFEYGIGANIKKQANFTYQPKLVKRRFSLITGIKRLYKEYADFFGLSSLSDHLIFTGVLSTIFIAAMVTLPAKLQLLFI